MNSGGLLFQFCILSKYFAMLVVRTHIRQLRALQHWHIVFDYNASVKIKIVIVSCMKTVEQSGSENILAK